MGYRVECIDFDFEKMENTDPVMAANFKFKPALSMCLN
jgi:hypothetical protein